jgi:hypothetical protein
VSLIKNKKEWLTCISTGWMAADSSDFGSEPQLRTDRSNET